MTTMRTLVLTLAAAGLSACAGSVGSGRYCADHDYSDAVECLEAKYVGLSEACSERVMSTTVRTVSDSAIDHMCASQGVRVDGCLARYDEAPWGMTVVLLSDSEDGQTVDTLAHELMHVALECETGSADVGHTSELWDGLR